MDRERPSDIGARVHPFSDALASGDANLAEMALTLSLALQPGLDVIGSLADLDELAADCPVPTRDGVIGYLSGRFTGDRDDYHRWQNSCIDHVLVTRRGMPITLSVIAIEVGRRLGVDLVGVGMPGHFLVGDGADPEWFADPFGGRTDLGRDDCREILRTLGGRRWSQRFLDPTPDRLIVARMLNNLRASCTSRRDRVRLAIVMQLRQEMVEFADEYEDALEALIVLN